MDHYNKKLGRLAVKAPIFIDGGYLSKISREFGSEGNPIKIDINRFCHNLAKKQGLWANKIFYYTAPPYQSPKPTEEEKTRRANYDKFVTKLGNIPKVKVWEGRC